ncbi:hypothetical protein Q1695_007139 [Nippostrongylus brasiliensis]|nr:hypothetical protein Q1695_007139 [Nippostrongylus brasiliensis]
MSPKAPSVDKRIIYNNCLQYLNLYINDLSAIEEEVFNVLKEEIKPENVCEPSSIPKYLTALSKFASLNAALDDIYKNVLKCYSFWKDKVEPLARKSAKGFTYAELPVKLAGCFFLNGDYYKALLCLRHSINLEPKSLIPRIVALRWSVYLGEWEMLEMALAFEKLKPPKSAGSDDFVTAQLLFTTELARNYLEFNRDHKSRTTTAKRILEMTNEVNTDTRSTFPTFESQSFANWICSHLPKVAGIQGNDLELLDSFNCLHRAVTKSEGVTKNRLPGIHKDGVPLNIRSIASNTNDFFKACVSFAESCDMRRDYTIELLNVGLIRNAGANAQLGLWSVLKSGVLFRIQQFVNVNTLMRMCVVHPDYKNDVSNCMEMIRSMYSNEASPLKNFFGCTTKKPPEAVVLADEFSEDSHLPVPPPSSDKSPSRQKSIAASLMESFEELRLERVISVQSFRSTKTPSRGRAPGRIAAKVLDSFQELTLSESKSFLHEVSDECKCNVCTSYNTNFNIAFEYWFSSFLYESMSNSAMQLLEENFHSLRSRVAQEQCLVLGKKVKPRPPTSMCEIFAMCVVRWLRRLEDSNWDKENSKLKVLRDTVVKSALKICGYSGVRTVCYRLAIAILERLQNVSQQRRFEWMRDNSIGNRLMSAVSQYIFPSRICGARDVGDDEDSPEAAAQRNIDKAMVHEATSEYASYSNLLYRDWRFPLCTFLGEFVTNPWEAAMMWSESTLLATRQTTRHLSGKMVGIAFSQPALFKKMIQKLPDDFTVVHLALSHDGSLHLIKMHKDRDPIVMPLAPKSKVESVKSMMDNLIDENTRTCNLGKLTKDAKAFWAARRAVDAELKALIPRVQEILLGAAAPLLLPSTSITTRQAISAAQSLITASKSPGGAQLPLSFAKELTSLSTKLTRSEWIGVVERLCDVAGVSAQKGAVQGLYASTKATMAKAESSSSKSPAYTFLIVCPDLTTFPWEVVPVFRDSPYVARVASVHALFRTLNKNDQIPFEVNVNNAFYVLDPDNNLGDTRKRITDFVSKFGWKGVVGKVPSTEEMAEALKERDVFL